VSEPQPREIKMSEFQKGDKVKFSFEYSVQMFYGTVRMVRVNNCLVEVIDNFTGKSERVIVAKNILNFD